MNPLDLNRLNVQAPYSVWEVRSGSYSFKTDYGILYRAIFTPDETIWQNGAYEFGILNENNKPSPSDNKQAMRDRLFLQWFMGYERHELYYIKVAEIEAEGISNYAAVIVQRSNPNLNMIISDFDNFVNFFKEKPQ